MNYKVQGSLLRHEGFAGQARFKVQGCALRDSNFGSYTPLLPQFLILNTYI